MLETAILGLNGAIGHKITINLLVFHGGLYGSDSYPNRYWYP